MNKQKIYSRVRFDSKTLFAAEKSFKSLSGKIQFVTLAVQFADATWTFDTLEEFLAAADRGVVDFFANGNSSDRQLFVKPIPGREMTMVIVKAPTREEIESVFAIFESDLDRCRLPEQEKPEKDTRVFIGHGRDPQWRESQGPPSREAQLHCRSI